MFVNELTSDEALQFSTKQFKKIAVTNPSSRGSQDSYQNEEEVEKRTKVIAKRVVEVKSKINNYILDLFYQNSSVDGAISNDSDDESSFKNSNLDQSEKQLDSIMNAINQNLKKVHTLDIPVTTSYNSKYRFILFNEMVTYLYDFLSSSLMVKRNYYESLVLKTNDLSNFYSTTHNRKKELHNKNLEITLQLIDYQDRMAKVENQIKDKENTLKSQRQELAEHDEKDEDDNNNSGGNRYRGFMSNRSDIELAINFTQKAIVELKEELLRLNQHHDEIKLNLGGLENVISDTEISNVRSAQILNSIIDNADIAKKELESVKKRIKNVLGDSILLAATVVYLGVFCIKNRISMRKKIADMLTSFEIS